MSELTKSELLRNTITNLEDKNFKILFFVPDTSGVASAAVIEIYNQALVLRKAGYNANILVQNNEFGVPQYLDQELQALPHLYSEGSKFTISAEDWLVIPEFFSNIMKQTEKLPCKRIVLAQSYDLTISSLVAGMTWKQLGIDNVITTSSKLKEFIEEYHGAKSYDIQTYQIGIPDYFKPSVFKKPIITFYSRNAQDIVKLNKLFYLKYPELQWVMFEDLRGTTREEFANKLSQSTVCVWIDRIAAFGTFPIEAMKTDTVVVGLVPEKMPEYVGENNGFWAYDPYELPNILGKVVKASLLDGFNKELRTNMAQTAEKYNVADSNESIMGCYDHFFTVRKKELEDALAVAKENEEKVAKLIVVEDTEEN